MAIGWKVGKNWKLFYVKASYEKLSNVYIRINIAIQTPLSIPTIHF